MAYFISIAVAIAIIACAAWILIRRMFAFKQTCGRSACENCPYSGGCERKKQ